MFTSPSPRAVVEPGALLVREQRLDDVVRRLDVRGTLDARTLPQLGGRIDAAAAAGVRWLIVDLAGAVAVADEAVEALAAAARALRSRGGELIVAGAAERLAPLDVAHRPAQAASVDEAVMLLKQLRPGSGVRRAGQRIAALMLPRIEPTA